jgi:hypothetical protein
MRHAGIARAEMKAERRDTPGARALPPVTPFILTVGIGLELPLLDRTNARNQGAERAAAQRPTAPRAGAFATP